MLEHGDLDVRIVIRVAQRAGAKKPPARLRAPVGNALLAHRFGQPDHREIEAFRNSRTS